MRTFGIVVRLLPAAVFVLFNPHAFAEVAAFTDAQARCLSGVYGEYHAKGFVQAKERRALLLKALPHLQREIEMEMPFVGDDYPLIGRMKVIEFEYVVTHAPQELRMDKPIAAWLPPRHGKEPTLTTLKAENAEYRALASRREALRNSPPGRMEELLNAASREPISLLADRHWQEDQKNRAVADREAKVCLDSRS